jgi:hypothetical protein
MGVFGSAMWCESRWNSLIQSHLHKFVKKQPVAVASQQSLDCSHALADDMPTFEE